MRDQLQYVLDVLHSDEEQQPLSDDEADDDEDDENVALIEEYEEESLPTSSKLKYAEGEELLSLEYLTDQNNAAEELEMVRKSIELVDLKVENFQ
jgi:hypothetical protein